MEQFSNPDGIRIYSIPTKKNMIFKIEKRFFIVQYLNKIANLILFTVQYLNIIICLFRFCKLGRTYKFYYLQVHVTALTRAARS